MELQKPRLYIDFIRKLPPEICLKILSYLDSVSLVRLIQTCRPWCDLALDSQLWERLYYLEGWKAIESEIQSSEAKVNIGLNDSISHLHRIHNSEGQTSKIRAIVHEEDTDMTNGDTERSIGRSDSNGSWSLFGSATSSFSSNALYVLTPKDSDLGSSAPGFRSLDRSLNGEQRPRRRDAHISADKLPPILPPQDPRALRRSTLWMWDGKHSKYRINWKYLYNMRRRLESNWELGKFTTFQFPHPLYPEEGHQECIYSLQFDHNYMVSGSKDWTMRIWNVHTRRLIGAPLVGHTGSVLCLQFDSDPEEDLLVSGSSDSDIILWRFSTGEILQKLTKAHREAVLNVRFDKRILVTSSKDKTIKIFNRRPLRYGDVGYGTVDPISTNLRRYGYEPDLAHELPVKPAFSLIATLEGHNAAVNAIQVRDDIVISVSGDRQIKVWRWPEQFCVRTIPAHDKGIACVEYDGRRIVSGSNDQKVSIFDAITGVNVADLRGHTALVRTVQAGFGDLPYSTIEDELEARRADSERIKSGEVDLSERANRPARRRANPGSSRHDGAISYGAKLPEGGGGGRVYGRIVSGSYDTSIIVWRRDKEGGWVPAHHLRQEEAAAAAQRQAVNGSVDLNVALNHADQVPSYAPIRPLVPQAMPYAAGMQLSGGSQLATLPLPHVHDAQPHLASSVYTALIDQAVPAGPVALRQALTNYPGILAYQNYLQAIIERESSTTFRAQLREVVSDALFSASNVQWVSNPNAMDQTSQPARSSTSTITPSSMVAATSSSSAAGTDQVAPQAPQPSAVDTPQPQPAQAVISTPQAAPQQPQNETHPPQAAIPDQTLRPLLVAPENVPQRIFKLQFDARKIICCSQAHVIVGWDFCNGDPELEEASRFFATVE